MNLNSENFSLFLAAKIYVTILFQFLILLFQDFEKWKERKDEKLIEEHKKKVEERHRKQQEEKMAKKEKEKESQSAFSGW